MENEKPRKKIAQVLADEGYPPIYTVAKRLEIFKITEDDGGCEYVGLGIVGIEDEKLGVVFITTEKFADLLAKGGIALK